MKLEVINHADQHFMVSSDRPMRIEVSVVSGKVIAHAYEGDAVDQEQEPSLVYDGTLDYNEDQFVGVSP